jgi:hypothetical protein
VLISVTTGPDEEACWAAATAATCPELTQLACAKSADKNDGTNAKDRAVKILNGVLIVSPC